MRGPFAFRSPNSHEVDSFRPPLVLPRPFRRRRERYQDIAGKFSHHEFSNIANVDEKRSDLNALQNQPLSVVHFISTRPRLHGHFFYHRDIIYLANFSH